MGGSQSKPTRTPIRTQQFTPRPMILAKMESASARSDMQRLKKMYGVVKKRDKRINMINKRANLVERTSAAKQSRMEAVMSHRAQQAAEARRRYLQLFSNAAALKAYATRRMRDLKQAAKITQRQLQKYKQWQARVAPKYKQEMKRGARAKMIGRMANYEESNAEHAARSIREGIAPVRQQL